jgi:hypothetical protein
MLFIEHLVAPIPGYEICNICKICTCSTTNEDDPEVKTWLIDARSVFSMIFLREHITDLQGCRIEGLNLIFPARNSRFSILVSIQGFRCRLLPRADICQMRCVVHWALHMKQDMPPLRQAIVLTRWRQWTTVDPIRTVSRSYSFVTPHWPWSEIKIEP